MNTTECNSSQAFIALMSIVIASSAEKNIIASWTNRHFVSLAMIYDHAEYMKHVLCFHDINAAPPERTLF